MEDERVLTWRKSSYSGNNGGQCIEVAAPGYVVVRDSKDPDGVVLRFPVATWREFLCQAKNAVSLQPLLGRVLVLAGDVASPLGNSEDQPGFPEQLQRVQHSIPAHSVLVLQVSHGWQRPCPPLARLDPPPQDVFQLTVGRNGQTGIN
jgi:hypothetical protein